MRFDLYPLFASGQPEILQPIEQHVESRTQFGARKLVTDAEVRAATERHMLTHFLPRDSFSIDPPWLVLVT